MTRTDLRCQDSKLLTPGQSVAGVDGCKGGWVMVRRDERGRFSRRVVRSLDELPDTGFVLIDIPIGLPVSGRRNCDREARKVLGPKRGRSVFSGARRPLLTMKNRESAHAWGRRQDDLGVTKQLWAIMPKIREVDDWIRAGNRPYREGHPELSFYALAGRSMEHNKKKTEGRDERLRLLTAFIEPTMVCGWLELTRGSGAGKDDVLDALVLCRSAARFALGCHCMLPDDPPLDSEGLAMAMVY